MRQKKIQHGSKGYTQANIHGGGELGGTIVSSGIISKRFRATTFCVF